MGVLDDDLPARIDGPVELVVAGPDAVRRAGLPGAERGGPNWNRPVPEALRSERCPGEKLVAPNPGRWNSSYFETGSMTMNATAPTTATTAIASRRSTFG